MNPAQNIMGCLNSSCVNKDHVLKKKHGQYLFRIEQDFKIWNLQEGILRNFCKG